MEDYQISGELPPRIKSMVRQLRLALAISGVLMFGLAAFMAVIIPMQEGEDALPFMLIPILILPASWGAIYLILKKTVLRNLYKAARTMRMSDPEAMILRNYNIFESNGYLVGLYGKDAPPPPGPEGDATPPRVLIQARSNRKGSPFGKKDVPVNVWVDPQSHPPFVVLESEKQLLWGQISNRESRARNTRAINRIVLGMLALLAILGATFFAFQWHLLQGIEAETALAVQSAEWPLAEGVVNSSSIEQVRISRGKSSVKGYEAEVRYSYQVGGRSFSGETIHFCYEPTTRPGDAEAIVSQLPAGGGVNVAYMPEDPRVATLFPGYSDACEEQAGTAVQTLVVVTGMSVMMLLVLALVFTFQIRRRTRLLRKVEEWGLP